MGVQEEDGQGDQATTPVAQQEPPSPVFPFAEPAADLQIQEAAAAAAQPLIPEESGGELCEGLAVDSAHRTAVWPGWHRRPTEAGAPSEGDQSWKEWAGRPEGSSSYKFGDITRKGVSFVQTQVRGLKHTIGERMLDVKEQGERRVATVVDQVLEGQEGGMAGSTSHGTNAERWWCQACQLAHKNHRKEDEQQDRLPSSRGSVKVTVLELGAVRRSSGEAAVEPVCQLALEGCMTGALYSAEDAGKVSTARFFFEELSRCDLQVRVWDRKDVRFTLGFEDQTLCGGAFVPLLAVVQQECNNHVDAWMHRREFTTRIKVKLLPLKLVRAKSKLEPAEDSGVWRPKHDHGHLVLGLELNLFETPLQLYFAVPFMGAPQKAKVVGHVSDPMGTLKAAGVAVARAGKAANIVSWAAAVDKLRENPVSAVLFQLWWAFTALRAPLVAWPVLVVLAAALLPPLAWSLGAVSRAALGEERLYVDEVPATESERDSNSHLEKLVKGVTTILRLTDRLTAAAVQVEKVRFLMAFADPAASALFTLLALALAVAAGAGLQLLLLLAQWGWLRTCLWLWSSIALAPRSCREACAWAAAEIAAACQKVMGDRCQQQALAFWDRVPDAVEVCHLQLCRGYVFDFVPGK